MVKFLVKPFLSLFEEESLLFLLFAAFKEARKEIGELESFDKAKVIDHALGYLISFRIVWYVCELLRKGGLLSVRVVFGTRFRGL